MTETIWVSTDLGNDSSKTNFDFNKQNVVIPSVIGDADTNLEKVTFDTKSAEKAYMKNFLREAIFSVASPVVQTSGRFYLGQAAIDNNRLGRRFDINNFSGKSQDDLSLLLALGSIAAYGVQKAYNEHKDPTNLEYNVNLTTALPIREGKTLGVIDRYQEKFLKSPHVVNFYNFKDIITVTLKFNFVKVTLEGQASQLAITNSVALLPKLATGLKADMDKHYPKLSNLPVDVIVNAKNVLLIDIGGKTVDFAVITNGKANVNTSTSSMRGYDNVLLQAIDTLQSKQRNFSSIGQLESYLQAGPSPFDPSSYQQVASIVKADSQDLSQDITDQMSKTLGQGNLNPELIIVTGGGSIPMRKDTDLRKKLDHKIASFTNNHVVPVLCVPEEYAQFTNLIGLQLLLRAAQSRMGSENNGK